MYIKTFGKLTDIINPPFDIKFPVSMRDFRENLEIQYSKLSEMEYKIAVNHHVINDEELVIVENDEIALLPPFSGG